VHYPQQQTHSPLVDNIISQAEFKLYDGLGRALVNRGIPWGVDIAPSTSCEAGSARSLGGGTTIMAPPVNAGGGAAGLAFSAGTLRTIGHTKHRRYRSGWSAGTAVSTVIDS
jgi:hypothetical protein